MTPKEFNRWRVMPRILIGLYGLMCWRIAEWFMDLPDPTSAQTVLVTTIWGAAAVWFNFYVKTGNNTE